MVSLKEAPGCSVPTLNECLVCVITLGHSGLLSTSMCIDEGVERGWRLKFNCCQWEKAVREEDGDEPRLGKRGCHEHNARVRMKSKSGQWWCPCGSNFIVGDTKTFCEGPDQTDHPSLDEPNVTWQVHVGLEWMSANDKYKCRKPHSKDDITSYPPVPQNAMLSLHISAFLPKWNHETSNLSTPHVSCQHT